jgi:uncharacterized membrane protein YdcZ (DUF606 family)
LVAIGVIFLLITGTLVLADLPNTIEKVGNLRTHMLIGGLVGALVISRFILRRRLAIARQIARAHGGDVTLRNRSGSGLQAAISLSRNVASV